MDADENFEVKYGEEIRNARTSAASYDAERERVVEGPEPDEDETMLEFIKFLRNEVPEVNWLLEVTVFVHDLGYDQEMVGRIMTVLEVYDADSA